MIAGTNIPNGRIRDRLQGQHLLVTGSTGFLAKVFVELGPWELLAFGVASGEAGGGNDHGEFEAGRVEAHGRA